MKKTIRTRSERETIEFGKRLAKTLESGSVLALEGGLGSGKTTLGVQVLHSGLARYHDPGILIAFEEFPVQLYRQCERFGFDLAQYEKSGQLRVIWTSPDRVMGSLTGRDDLLGAVIREMGVRRVLIDSITHFHRVVDGDKELREMLLLKALAEGTVSTAPEEATTGKSTLKPNSNSFGISHSSNQTVNISK